MILRIQVIVIYACLTLCLYGNFVHFTNGEGVQRSSLIDSFPEKRKVLNGDVAVDPQPPIAENTTTETPATEGPNTTVQPNTTTTVTPTPPGPNTTTTVAPTPPGPNTTTTTTTPQPITTTTTPQPNITTTTPSPTTSTTTSTPPTSTVSPITTVPPAPTPDRRYDGPSFIGGIVFTLGLMAIGFVSWKFYKARTERNYHTL